MIVYDEYVICVFKVNSVDYLFKFIFLEDFSKVLDKWKEIVVLIVIDY